MRKREATVGRFVDHHPSGDHLGVIVERHTATVFVSRGGVRRLAAYGEIRPCDCVKHVRGDGPDE
jgi:hypothetical protein